MVPASIAPPVAAVPAVAPAAVVPAATAVPEIPQTRWQRFAKFLTQNHNFVSSVVIGGAGLMATSLYQCNQTQMARQQAESQQRIAREQADNNWRIERAKILSQNLQTLTARGGDNVEQRYGVLLSLTRGSILEPDVAVSYALELGKDNPEYMSSVLSNIERKDDAYYRRLATAYQPTCQQRYGVSSLLLEQCRVEKLMQRSVALAGTISDETEDALLSGTQAAIPLSVAQALGKEGPLRLLADEHAVESDLVRLCGLFAPFLQEMYERRQLSSIEKFLQYSAGARLVGSLMLLTQTVEVQGSADHDHDSSFHTNLQDWLGKFLTGPSCDGECRARVLSVMLSHYGRGQRYFVPLVRSLLKQAHGEAAAVLTRLSSRLMWCQMAAEDIELLRDQVLVPVLLEELKPLQLALAALPSPSVAGPAAERGKGMAPAVAPASKPGTAPAVAAVKADLGLGLEKVALDRAFVEDLVEVLALVPEPKGNSADFALIQTLLGKLPDGKLLRVLTERRDLAQTQRRAATQALLIAAAAKEGKAVPLVTAKKRNSFCQVGGADTAMEEEE